MSTPAQRLAELFRLEGYDVRQGEPGEWIVWAAGGSSSCAVGTITEGHGFLRRSWMPFQAGTKERDLVGVWRHSESLVDTQDMAVLRRQASLYVRVFALIDRDAG